MGQWSMCASRHDTLEAVCSLSRWSGCLMQAGVSWSGEWVTRARTLFWTDDSSSKPSNCSLVIAAPREYPQWKGDLPVSSLSLFLWNLHEIFSSLNTRTVTSTVYVIIIVSKILWNKSILVAIRLRHIRQLLEFFSV